jgi:hypothetical protein
VTPAADCEETQAFSRRLLNVTITVVASAQFLSLSLYKPPSSLLPLLFTNALWLHHFLPNRC